MLKVPERNILAILKLADFMESLQPDKYRQDTFDSGCGQGCIAYWACVVANVEAKSIEAAKNLLGLDSVKANALFSTDGGTRSMMGLMWRGPIPKEAAQVLREMAVTGEVPGWWSKRA